MRHTIVSALLLMFATSFSSVAALAASDAPVMAKVVLSPIGSFEASAKQIIGKGEKTGDVYTAKELKVLVNQLSTGMSLRDKHLKDTLNAKDHKYIVVSNVKATKGSGTGEITINGIKKPVTFAFKDNGGKDATATFKISLKDFNIKGISYQGVGVQDAVEISATVPYETKK
jgi:polyisoprenoid-binding protein YceI